MDARRHAGRSVDRREQSTPYYVTLTRLSVNGEPVVLKHGAVDVAPFGRAEIPIDRQIGAGAIVFDAVDESGASHEYRAQAVPP